MLRDKLTEPDLRHNYTPDPRQVSVLPMFKKTNIVLKENAMIIKLSEGSNTASCTVEEISFAERKLPFAQLKKQLSYISPLLSDPGDIRDICFLSSFKHVLRRQASPGARGRTDFKHYGKFGINTTFKK